MAQIDSIELFRTAKEKFIANEYRLAETLLNQYLMFGNPNPEVFYMLGTIYYDQGKFNKAVKAFQRSLEIDPTFTDSSVGLSIILNDLGRYEEGRDIFVKAQEVLDKKNREEDPFVEEKLALKHEDLAQTYFQYKRFDEALEQYYKALRLTTRKPEVTMKIVECYIQKGAEKRALKELRILMKDFPQFLPARVKLGLILYQANKFVEAVEEWEGALLRDPVNAEATRYLKMVQESGLVPLI